jgi:hypothetical protein
VSSSNVIYSSSNSPICRTIIVVRFIIGCVNRYTNYSLELPRSFTSLQPFKTSLLLSLLISTISILETFFVFFQVAFSFFFLASRCYFSPFYFLLRVASNSYAATHIGCRLLCRINLPQNIHPLNQVVFFIIEKIQQCFRLRRHGDLHIGFGNSI